MEEEKTLKNGLEPSNLYQNSQENDPCGLGSTTPSLVATPNDTDLDLFILHSFPLLYDLFGKSDEINHGTEALAPSSTFSTHPLASLDEEGPLMFTPDLSMLPGETGSEGTGFIPLGEEVVWDDMYWGRPLPQKNAIPLLTKSGSSPSNNNKFSTFFFPSWKPAFSHEPENEEKIYSTTSRRRSGPEAEENDISTINDVFTDDGSILDNEELVLDDSDLEGLESEENKESSNLDLELTAEDTRAMVRNFSTDIINTKRDIPPCIFESPKSPGATLDFPIARNLTAIGLEGDSDIESTVNYIYIYIYYTIYKNECEGKGKGKGGRGEGDGS